MKSSAQFLAIAAMVAAICFADGQDLTKHVTYVTGAVSARRLTQELTRLTGVPFDVSQVTAPDVLVVSATDVPLSDLMRQIAKASGCDWKSEGTGFRLTRDAGKAQAQERADLQQRTAAMRAEIAKQTAILDKVPKFDRAVADKLAKGLTNPQAREARVRSIGTTIFSDYADQTASAPIRRTLFRILRSLDPAVLVGVAADSRIVMATPPTRMQRPLPGAAISAINQFLQEQQIWSEASAKLLNALPDTPNGGRGMAGVLDAVAINEPIEKVELIVSRVVGYTLSVELRLLSAKGSILATGDAKLSDSSYAEPTPRTAQQVREDSDVDLSPATRELESLAASDYSDRPDNSMARKITPDLQGRLLHPEIYDPLGLFPSDFLLSYAKRKNSNLVAYLSDSMLGGKWSYLVGPKPKVEAAKAILDQYGILKFEESQSWISISPQYRSEGWTQRTDRFALRQLVGGLGPSHQPSLDALAAYALRAPNLSTDPVAQQTLIGMPSGATYFKIPRWDLLRLYGALTPFQRNELVAGNLLEVASLSGYEQNLLTHMVFYSLHPMVSQRLPGMANADTPPDEMVELDTTDSMPNGLPYDGQVKLEVTNDEVVVPVSDNPLFVRPLGARQLGSWKAFAEKPDIPNDWNRQLVWIRQLVKVDKFRPGERKQYNFTFVFTPQFSMSDSLTDLLPKGDATDYAGLPEAFRTACEEALKQTRVALKDVQPESFRGNGGRERPPPPSARL